MKKIKHWKIRKRWIAGGVILCMLVVAVGVNVTYRNPRVKGEKGNQRMEAVVRTGTIQTSVSGTGTISYADTTEIVLPSDLILDEILVSEGSFVTAGSLLATVDEASLASCLNEVEEAISEADSTISSESSNSASQSVKAGVAGRVKKIYADKDDNVVDVMREQGALMLLSVDGLMAVELTGAGNVAAGDEVKVSSGDTETEGTVESVDSNGAVITFDDSVFDYGEDVMITSEDGMALGNGMAYIHQMIQVIGSSGTISSLNVSLNSSVSASTAVYTLDGSARSAEYMQAVKEREQLVSLLDALISIETDGGIVAASDGMVETINITSSAKAATSNQSSSDTGFTVGETGKEEKILTEKEIAEGNISNSEKQIEISEGMQLTSGEVKKTSGFMTMSSVQEIELPATSEFVKTSIEAPQNVAGGAGVITGTTIDMEYAAEENADSWTACTDGSTKVAAGTWYIRYRENDRTNASLAIQVTVVEESTEQQNKEQTSQDVSPAPSSQTEGNSATEKTDTTGMEKENTTDKVSANLPDNTASASSVKKSTNDSSGSGYVSTLASSSGNSTSDSVETACVFVIANGDKMKVTMNVDELDIGSMKEGMSAEITLDAIEGETFIGEITSVSGNASAGNGVAQYPVEITFEKTADMLSGMNASVSAIIEQAENVLTIPLIAVTDMGVNAYVYTGYDESSGELTGQTEVILGLSDENNVEIKSGLSDGDMIYYQMLGSEDDGNNVGNGMDGFNMKGMGGMREDAPKGDIPNGGKGQFKNGSGDGNGDMRGGAPQ